VTEQVTCGQEPTAGPNRVRNRIGGQKADERNDDHNFDQSETFVIVQIAAFIDSRFGQSLSGTKATNTMNYCGSHGKVQVESSAKQPKLDKSTQ
jgi:hypothetical protein